ncbi:MAG: alpha/beta hydrolase [Acidobacteriota bacterium]
MSKLVKQDQFGRTRYGASAALLLMISAASLAQTSHLAPTSPAQPALSSSRVPTLAGAPATEAGAAATQDAAIADKYATVFGAKIHYLEAGSGPVVILLHGLGGSTANWAPTIAPLAQKYRVIVPDQIGFGKSDKPMLNYRVGTLVDFLDGFYKQVGIQKASLVGNSLGGFTAAAFAIAYPEKVDKLVLVDAAGFAITGDLDPKVLKGLNASTRQQVRDLISLVFYNKAPFSSDMAVDAFLASRVTAGDGYTISRFIDSIAHGEDMLDGKLGAIKHPTLIIWGREDGLTQLAMGQRFNKEIAGSQLFIIEKCGHVPQLEKAAEFNAGLMKFLAGLK